MIHYHGTPCGGTREDVARFLSGRHALIPWPRHEDIATACEVCESFVIDNGAFTAWKKGQPVRCWDGYYAWLNVYKQHPACDWAIIPDVIDGSEADNDALEREWPHGKSFGVPVWHLHESFERLERMVSEWPRIALGSSGAYANPGTGRWWGRIEDSMAVICDRDGRPRTRLHGLRMLDPAIFYRVPLSSADSTNAVRNADRVKAIKRSAAMSMNADRSEAHQSCDRWVSRNQQGWLEWHEPFELQRQ